MPPTSGGSSPARGPAPRSTCLCASTTTAWSAGPNATTGRTRTRRKGDFLGDDTGTQIRLRGEIREPRTFRDLIEPYARTDNTEFARVMDCLNDRLRKKELGAFFTPEPYARLAAQLVLKAVERVPEGNDYIILDRCAGTGNLELALEGLVGPDGTNLLSHCVVSTYEYYEYKVLFANLNGLVREIIPPTEANVVYESGLVANADAMSEEYVNNPVIKRYVDDPTCIMILYENVPYQDSTSITFTDGQGRRASASRNDSFVRTEFKSEITRYGSAQASANDIANLFIWSAQRFYMRQPTDSYVVFSPVKYFKSMGLVRKRFLGGFLCNRAHFHASASAISCALWTNEDDTETREWSFPAYDILPDSELSLNGVVTVRACENSISKLQDARTVSDGLATNVILNRDGTQKICTLDKGRAPVCSTSIIGYMEFSSFLIDGLNRTLVRCNWYKGLREAHGFHLRSDNYLTMLPGFCAKLFPEDQWYEKGIYYTTADGGDAYTRDPSFLKSCLIYTCLSNQNKCLSFHGSDGRDYQNELCLDDTDGRAPLALRDLRAYAEDPATAIDGDEEELLGLWRKILEQARGCEGYDPKWSYGVYQISRELDTRRNVGTKHRRVWVYDHPQLHSDLDTLRVRLKEYYKSHITPKMFQYQLLK